MIRSLPYLMSKLCWKLLVKQTVVLFSLYMHFRIDYTGQIGGGIGVNKIATKTRSVFANFKV